MRFLRTILILSLLTSSAYATDLAQQRAFTRVGSYIFFQYGVVYSSQYAEQINQYNPLSVEAHIGADTMERFGFGYNVNPNLAFEAAFADTGIESNSRSGSFLSSNVTIQRYDYDVYNLEMAAVFKNGFNQLNTNVYAKFGLVYSYGDLGIQYDTTSSSGPSWNNRNPHYRGSFTASAVAPMFDAGVAWSASRYLALTLDYERVFNPVIGKGQFADPMKSKLQVLNMFLLGAVYKF
jgi:hypothetical protein